MLGRLRASRIRRPLFGYCEKAICVQRRLLRRFVRVSVDAAQAPRAFQVEIQSMVENFTVRSERSIKVGDLATLGASAALSPFVVGSPQDGVDELIAWADETDVDGFSLFRRAGITERLG
jgi:alkanesulfonate monooxygenase SsuD/methylene tetrahydromethanopterin reductase-like flavin-dependent oxidoreductase (luciferase family)